MELKEKIQFLESAEEVFKLPINKFNKFGLCHYFLVTHSLNEKDIALLLDVEVDDTVDFLFPRDWVQRDKCSQIFLEGTEKYLERSNFCKQRIKTLRRIKL